MKGEGQNPKICPRGLCMALKNKGGGNFQSFQIDFLLAEMAFISIKEL